MIAIVDYGVGNLFSLQCSLTALGLKSVITNSAAELLRAERVILPGVGAFGDAMKKLCAKKLVQPLQKLAAESTPLLGICLGMQLLFDSSEEFGSHEGLGLVPGHVAPLAPALQSLGLVLKVPHMGWNALRFTQPNSPLLKNSREGQAFYYVHSFYATQCEQSTVGQSEYGVMVPGVVQNKNVYGTQFHPEKSGECGLAMLKAFAEVT